MDENQYKNFYAIFLNTDGESLHKIRVHAKNFLDARVICFASTPEDYRFVGLYEIIAGGFLMNEQ